MAVERRAQPVDASIGCAFLSYMSFTFDYDTNPAIALIRILIPDTVEDPTKNLPVFSDADINAFYFIQQSQFQSSMFFSPPAGRSLPSSPLSYLRVAALALDVVANNAAMASVVIQLMDVKLGGKSSSDAISARADNFRKLDDESGAFVIIEQCFTVWGTEQRWWNQFARQMGGGVGA